MVLATFKYLPVFESQAISIFGLSSKLSSSIITIGVSYFSFQAISYFVDIYLELEKSEEHFGYYALYLSFFPKLLQGPIERSRDLLPQIRALSAGDIDQFRTGYLLIYLGLFKKIVIADRLSLFVNPVYSDVKSFSGIDLVLATYIYALQIYYDFSGYTDIARGTARIFNINLTENFNSPYTATSIADFWRRWHISFSSWIFDYIFKPLQMHWKTWRNWGTAVALMVTFLVSGIWHGASWNFLIWGGLHGLFIACSIFYKPHQKKIYRAWNLEKNKLAEFWQRLVTFNLVCLAWIFFKASSLNDAWYVVSHLFAGGTGQADLLHNSVMLSQHVDAMRELVIALVSIILLTLATALFKRRSWLALFYNKPFWVRGCVYYCVIVYLLMFGFYSDQSFAYVRF